MQKRYYSKRDWWLGLIIWGALLISFTIFAIEALKGSKELIAMSIIWSVIILFIGWIWFRTYYEFREDYLLVCSGPIRMKYYYKDIFYIKPSSYPWSAPALSVDRFAVYSFQGLLTYISPKNKDDFIEEIRSKKVNIVLK